MQVQALSPGFELNDVGFLPRVDAISTHAVLHYLDTDLKKYTREISAWVGKWQNFNFDGDTTGNGLNTSLFMEFKNYLWMASWAGGRASSIDDQRTRGGPLAISPASKFVGGEFGTDSRKRVYFYIGGEHVPIDDGGHGNYVWTTMTYRPLPSLRLSVSPAYNDVRTFAQYVTTQRGADYEPTFGDKYIFATLDQESFELGMRAEWTINSRLSAQLYLQPFIASGHYYDFKHLTRPKDDDYTPMSADEVGFSPDFNFRSVRGSAVVRWEFRPGSALYVVWNENRSDVAAVGDLRFRRDLSALPNAPSEDVFMIKFSYWLPI